MPKKFFTKKNILRLVLTLVIFCLVLVIGIFGYVQFASYKAAQVNFSLINSQVISNSNLIIISPNDFTDSNAPIYFIPGGLVQPESYIATIGKIASIRKTKAYIQKPLLNLAITNIDRSKELIKEYGIDKPIIGGHSLGGVVACRNVASSPELFSGLFLIGSYCDQSITTYQGKVNVIYGSNDKVLARDSFDTNKNNLPKSAIIEQIPGLNHSGLFDYGLQKGDGELTADKQNLIEKLAQQL